MAKVGVKGLRKYAFKIRNMNTTQRIKINIVS